MSPASRRALAGVIVAAAALRLPTLGQQSYWYDEAATVLVVKGNFGHMLDLLPNMEGNPPLFYVLSWAWAHIFGDREVALRSLSALAGLALVPVCFALGRRLGGERAGLTAALLCACEPFLVWFSQEARAYSLMALFAALALLCLLGRRLWLWALFGALAITTHYFAALFLAPMALLLLREHGARRAAPMLATLAAASAALAPLAIHQHDHARKSIVGSFSTRLVQLPKQLLVGYHLPGDRPLAVASAVLALFGLCAALRKGGAAPKVLALCAGSLALVALLAAAGLDYLDSRNMIFLIAPMAAVLGVGMANRPAALAALCALGVGAVVIVDTHASGQRDDWRGALRAVTSGPGPHALVVTPGQGYLPIAIYRPRVQLQLDAHPTVREIDVIGMAARASGNTPVPPPPGRVPPGFTPALIRRTALYTVERFVAPAPMPVPAREIGAARLGRGPPVVVID